MRSGGRVRRAGRLELYGRYSFEKLPSWADRSLFYRKIARTGDHVDAVRRQGRASYTSGNRSQQTAQRYRSCKRFASGRRDEEEAWSCEINANKAILALKHRGGGPAHINLATTYSRDYSVKELPSVRVIDRICAGDRFPEFPEGKVAVFVGSHPKWTSEQTEAVDRFCEAHDAVVFCDHTSNYKGRYRVLYSLVQNQKMLTTETNSVDLLIHIGEVSASYYPSARTVWRVSEDGEIQAIPFINCVMYSKCPSRIFFRALCRCIR